MLFDDKDLSIFENNESKVYFKKLYSCIIVKTIGHL